MVTPPRAAAARGGRPSYGNTPRLINIPQHVGGRYQGLPRRLREDRQHAREAAAASRLVRGASRQCAGARRMSFQPAPAIRVLATGRKSVTTSCRPGAGTVPAHRDFRVAASIGPSTRKNTSVGNVCSQDPCGVQSSAAVTNAADRPLRRPTRGCAAARATGKHGLLRPERPVGGRGTIPNNMRAAVQISSRVGVAPYSALGASAIRTTSLSRQLPQPLTTCK